MKGKRLLYMPLIAMLVLGMAMVGVGAWTPPTTPPDIWLYAEDYEFFTEADITGTQFDVNVTIYNVTNLGAVQFKLGYNTTILDAISCSLTPISTTYLTDYIPINLTTGEWDATSGIYDADGYVMFGAIVKAPASPYNGDGALLTITFEITLAPPLGSYPTPQNRTVSCPLDLYETTLGWVEPTFPYDTGSYVLNTDYSADDGSYAYIRPQIVAGEPVADFTWTPPYPFVGDTVTVTSNSTPNGGAIVSYDWTLTGDATWTTANGAPTRKFHCDGPGTVTVTLNVTDDENMSDTGSHDITQTAKPAALLDVFTIKSWLGNDTLYRERGGGALHAAGSAFAPGETVTLRSIVTFTDLPIMAVWVSFQVNYPDGSPYASLADVTDVVGNATVSLRLPLVPVTGTYKVSSTARVLEMDVLDTLTFNVDWIITITGVTYPAQVARGTTASFTVYVKSIDPYDKYPVVITISVFDYMDQPLGTNSTFDMVIGTPSYELSKFIIDYPNAGYAWPGPGAYVKVNAYTDWPELGGSAYCPEVTKEFEILP